MLHKAELKDNPHNLENIPSDWSFWKNLNANHMWQLLYLALIVKDGQTKLPANNNLNELLESMLRRAGELNTPKMKEDCASLAKEFYSKEFGAFYGYGDQIGFLAVSAIANYYLGNFRDAAKLAGMLGDLYFLDRHFETDKYTTHFNMIAGLAYQQGHNIAKACHHYNQFLEVTGGGIHTPQDVYTAASYCEEHKLLTMTDYTLSLLHGSAERAREESNDQLADNLLALANKLEKRPVAISRLTLDLTDAQKNLKEVSKALFGEIAPKPVPQPETSLHGRLFAERQENAITKRWAENERIAKLAAKNKPAEAKRDEYSGPRIIMQPFPE